MHIACRVGNGNTLMATDSLESLGQKLTAATTSILPFARSKEEAARLFNGLSAGGK